MKPSDQAMDTVRTAQQALVDYEVAMEAILELTKLKTKQYYAVFEQLKEAGFTDQQAMDLLKARGEYL